MDGSQDGSLAARVDQLEQRVQDLQQHTRQLETALEAAGIVVLPLPDVLPERGPHPPRPSAAPTQAMPGVPRQPGAPATTPIGAPPVIPTPPPGVRSTADLHTGALPNAPLPVRRVRPASPSGGFDLVRNGEFWLNKVGISLLLFGVAFLFKYSVDQGWLVPSVRVGIGGAIGLILLVLGLRLYEDRPHFSQVLLGGSIGAFYISVYAGYQLFGLMPYNVAFGLMVSVTVLAFLLAVRQNAAVLSLIGTAGGLATPFVLYSAAHNLPGLIAYVGLVLLGTSAIYFYRGWHSLIWTAFAGVWATFAVAELDFLWLGAHLPADRWALQLGFAAGWLAFAALPVIRAVLGTRNPEGGQHPAFDPPAAAVPGAPARRPDRHVYLLTLITPVLALGLSVPIWDFSRTTWGLLILAGSAGYILAARALREVHPALGYTHALLALSFATLALVLLLEGSALYFALAAEATMLHLLAHRLKDRGTALAGHVLFAVVGIWFLWRVLFTYMPAARPFDAAALTDLVVIGLALLVSAVVDGPDAVWTYRVLGYLAGLAWLWRQWGGPGAVGDYLSAGWAIYSAGLLYLAIRSGTQYINGRPTPEWAAGHIGFLALGVWFVIRLPLAGLPDSALANARALSDLAAIGLVLGVATWLLRRDLAWLYRLAAHLALLAWFWHELSGLPNGNGLVTVTWTVYALALLIAGLPSTERRLIYGALGTLLLVVAKLFLIDLVALEAIWRILLFLSIGSMFLVLSYYLQSWLRRTQGV